jgi:hypothetical protein
MTGWSLEHWFVSLGDSRNTIIHHTAVPRPHERIEHIEHGEGAFDNQRGGQRCGFLHAVWNGSPGPGSHYAALLSASILRNQLVNGFQLAKIWLTKSSQFHSNNSDSRCGTGESARPNTLD